MKRNIKLGETVHLPDSDDLRLLREALGACQARWLSYYSGTLRGDAPGHMAAKLTMQSQFQRQSQSQLQRLYDGETIFRLNRLKLSGWLETLSIKRDNILVGLPLYVTMIDSTALQRGYAQSATDNPFLQAFRRLLGAQQHLIFACVAGEFSNAVEYQPALRVGGERGVPLALARALQSAGIAECYTTREGHEHYGTSVRAREGAAITLVVQDREVAQPLLTRLMAS